VFKGASKKPVGWERPKAEKDHPGISKTAGHPVRYNTQFEKNAAVKVKGPKKNRNRS